MCLHGVAFYDSASKGLFAGKVKGSQDDVGW